MRLTMSKATESRIPCSQDTRRRLSKFKQSPDNWDQTLRRLAEIAEEHMGTPHSEN